MRSSVRTRTARSIQPENEFSRKIERVQPENRDRLGRVVRSLVSAVTADCYRELGDVRTAAEWYRRAVQSWKVAGFAAIYADMVLQHGLEVANRSADQCRVRVRRDSAYYAGVWGERVKLRSEKLAQYRPGSRTDFSPPKKKWKDRRLPVLYKSIEARYPRRNDRVGDTSTSRYGMLFAHPLLVLPRLALLYVRTHEDHHFDPSRVGKH